MKVDGCVMKDEHYLRWIFDSRHIFQGQFKPSFISLRMNEKGISGQIFERLESENVIKESACRFVRSKEIFYGYALAKVEDIENCAIENDTINVVMTESVVPAHAEIRFKLDDVPVVGNTPNPRLSYYFNEIKDLLSRTVVQFEHKSYTSL